MKRLRIIIGCEFSQIVTKAFRAKGHEAFSCDLLPTEGNTDWHFQGDIFDLLETDSFDLGIFHPPCRYLTVTANRSFKNNPGRWQKRVDAMIFVHALMNAKIKRICIENPKGVISSYIRKPDQYIQPYQFGHPYSKTTGLWLKNLPLLVPTKTVEPEWIYPVSGGKRMSKKHYKSPSNNNEEKRKVRSRFDQGIADAMADQWDF